MIEYEMEACTTILVGKKASYDGSTLVARNEDSGSGSYNSKKFVVVLHEASNHMKNGFSRSDA